MEQILGVSIDGPSLSQMLEWSLDSKTLKALADLNPQLKQSCEVMLCATWNLCLRFSHPVCCPPARRQSFLIRSEFWEVGAESHPACFRRKRCVA